MERAVFRSRLLPYLLVLPQLAVTIIFFFWPTAQAIYQSMQLQDAFAARTQFVGFANFLELFRDPLYREAFGVTLEFSTLVAVFGIGLAFMLAVFAERVTRGVLIYRTLLIWPYAVAPAIAGVLWMFLLSPSLGILAHMLQAVGYDWNSLVHPQQAVALVVCASVWKQISYNFLFFLAGLQSIPRSLVEAAAIDGAGPLRRLFSIVVPLLTPTIFFLLVVNIVYAFFDTFAVIDAATHGGPAQATSTLVFKVYQDGMQSGDLGGSAAQSVVLMTIVILLTVVQFRFIERRVHY